MGWFVSGGAPVAGIKYGRAGILVFGRWLPIFLTLIPEGEFE
jgi:hypothetical protein